MKEVKFENRPLPAEIHNVSNEVQINTK